MRLRKSWRWMSHSKSRLGNSRGGEGARGAGTLGVAGGAHDPLGGRAECAKLLVFGFLPGPVQEFGNVHLRQFDHLTQGLVHEDAAAVDRRADGQTGGG